MVAAMEVRCGVPYIETASDARLLPLVAIDLVCDVRRLYASLSETRGRRIKWWQG